jgi:dephospho-CoA kinase
MKNKKIIAIIGMAGSGKSEAVNYIEKKYRCPKLYMGSPTFERIAKEGLAINWRNEKIFREKIREEMGMGAYAILVLPKLNVSLKNNNFVLIESLYSWDEYKIIKNKYKNNFFTIAIFASSATRFSRLKNRKIRPIKTLPELIKRDCTEIEGTDKGGPIALADFTIINENGLNNLHQEIDRIIKKIIK